MSTINIEGVEVQLEACGHCNALPTETDAAKAFQQAREAYKPCPACGMAIEIKSIEIVHQSRPPRNEAPQWKLVSVQLRNAVGLEVQGHKRAWMHEACKDRIFQGRLDRGAAWQPWCDDSLFTVTE